jgi:hypothetical protein
MNATDQPDFANCSLLASRTDFGGYVQELNSTTGFNVSLLEACKGDICNALWGDGNADISGIGVCPDNVNSEWGFADVKQMVVGYFLESIIGLFFALVLAFHEPISTKPPLTKYSGLFAEGCKIFFDCAVFFAISIQISCVVVLIRRDFGISANGLGGLTVQITWAVALLCMLPLLYPMFILEYTDREKSNYRLFLFCGCWLLFFYTFISQMIGDFGPSQIGQGAGGGGTTIITTDEWNTLTSLCLSGVKYLSVAEQRVLSDFGAAGSTIISAYGLLCLLWFIMAQQFPKQANAIRQKASSLLPESSRRRYMIGCLNIAVPLLTIPQLWGVLRLRGIQKGLANVTSNVYVDNQWTFGQVVAVMIFAPVFTEVGYLWIRERREYQPQPIKGLSLSSLKDGP